MTATLRVYFQQLAEVLKTWRDVQRQIDAALRQRNWDQLAKSISGQERCHDALAVLNRVRARILSDTEQSASLEKLIPPADADLLAFHSSVQAQMDEVFTEGRVQAIVLDRLFHMTGDLLQEIARGGRRCANYADQQTVRSGSFLDAAG